MTPIVTLNPESTPSSSDKPSRLRTPVDPGPMTAEAIADMDSQRRIDMAAQHLEALYPNGGAGGVVIFTLPDTKSEWFTDLDEAAAYGIARSDEGVCVYTSMARVPAGTSGRGTAAEVVALPGAWAEIDLGKGGVGPFTYEEATEVIRQVVGDPTWENLSGGGFHVGWMADEATSPWSPGAIDATKGIHAALAAAFEERGWQLDKVSDAARVLRLPGTWNWKLVRDGKATDPRPVTPKTTNGPRYNLSELRAKCPAPEGTTAGTSKTYNGPDYDEWSGEGFGYDKAGTWLEAKAADLSATRIGRNELKCQYGYTAGGVVRAGLLDLDYVVDTLTTATEAAYADRDLASHTTPPKYGEDVLTQVLAGMKAGPPRFALEWRKELDLGELNIVPELDDAFWTSRPSLETIRQAAHSRQRSAPAVLHAVLARVAAATPYTLQLPPTVGAAAPVCYFAAITSGVGIGKSTGTTVARELLPLGGYVADNIPLGSGEGLADLLFSTVPDEDDGRKTKRVRSRYNVYAIVDEGQVLAELSGRNGSTLLATLRSIWTGDVIGQHNASPGRSRAVAPKTYNYGLCMAVQEANAGALLDDAGGGLPQRFGWASAVDPAIPAYPAPLPVWPGTLSLPALPSVGEYDQTLGEVLGTVEHIGLPQSVTDEILRADNLRARGAATVKHLDEHEGLYRLKVAALLAILDGRTDVNEEDWDLARQVKAASDTSRRKVVGAVQGERAAVESSASKRNAERAVAVDSAVADAATRREAAKVIEYARKLAEKVHGTGEQSGRKVQQWARKWRNLFPEALDHAVAEGWVIERFEPGRGTSKRVIAPGPERP